MINLTSIVAATTIISGLSAGLVLYTPVKEIEEIKVNRVTVNEIQESNKIINKYA